MRQQKVCNAAERNKVAWECAVEKKLPYTANGSRTHKDAKLHEKNQHYNGRYMRIRWVRLYDEYKNVIGKEKKHAARKANRGEVSKTFRLHSAVAFQQPGVQLQGHEHCTGQAAAQHFQVGWPSQHPPGMLGV